MAKPRVFISSTFYDLRQVRINLDSFIESLGYESVKNEDGKIPYGKDDALEEYCYKEIGGVDILVSIIGGRFGSESQRNTSSISQIELKTAINSDKQVYIFIEKNVLSEYETYLLNTDSTINYRYVNDIRIYEFIEEIKQLKINNNIKEFETASDITEYLRAQFAGLFQRFLSEQTRAKEINLINNLEKTAQMLNKLVNFLTDDNKDQADRLNKFLTINHPLLNVIGDSLGITYKFYIDDFDDLDSLLKARGYKQCVEETDKNFYEWRADIKGKVKCLQVAKTLFDDESNLIFLKNSDWDVEYVMFEPNLIETSSFDF